VIVTYLILTGLITMHPIPQFIIHLLILLITMVFDQYANQPTRGDNILNIVMSTANTFLEDLAVSVPLGTSDHNTIILKTNVSVETTCPPTSTSYFDFEHADYDAINEYLAVTDWNDILVTA